MGDVFAIVSKAVFEKEARVDGNVIGLGEVWPIERYNGTGKVFESTLADGGRIFMVTVRPPDEKLWLLAILESPKFNAKAKAWIGTPNTTPATDISSLRKTIKFESGKGMSQDKGTLGMSLQTPRALGDGDADEIFALLGGGGGGGKKASKKSGAEAATPAKPKERAKLSTKSRDRVGALLQAISDDPDDDASRHVLADQYEAAGDADRANFIRSQVARAALSRWDARAVAMKLDERAFLRDHEKAWRAELPKLGKGIEWGAFERGLVAWLAFDDSEEIHEKIDAARAAAPITGVEMRWPRRGKRPKSPGAVEGLRKLVVTGTLMSKPDAEWLANSEILSTVEELTLDNSNLKDDTFEVLLKSKHLGKLRALRLPFHQLTNEGLEHLASASLPQLVELDLSVETMDRLGSGGRDGEGINGDGIVALCAWPQMAKIERLDLTGNQIGAAGLTAILTHKNTKAIKSLKIRSVSDYDMETYERPDVLIAFKNAKGDRSFEELDIGENELTSGAAKEIKGSPVLSKLKRFAFDFSGDEQLAKVMEASWVNSVCIMSLTDTVLPVVKKVLAQESKSLHTLDLTSCFPRSALTGVVNAIATGPVQKSLLSLDLYGCNLDDAAVKKLGSVKTLPALIELRFGANPETGYGDEENEYGDDVAKAFLDSALGKQLRSATVGVEALDRLPPDGHVSAGGGDGGDDDDDEDEYDDDDE